MKMKRYADFDEHVKVRKTADIDERAFGALLRQAAQG
jgi:hypothetical protein